MPCPVLKNFFEIFGNLKNQRFFGTQNLTSPSLRLEVKVLLLFEPGSTGIPKLSRVII